MEDIFPVSVENEVCHCGHHILSSPTWLSLPSHLLLAMREQHGGYESWQKLQSGSVNDNGQYGAFGNG